MADIYSLAIRGDDEDRSIATVDREGWERLANPTGQVDVKPPLTQNDSSMWTDSLGDVAP